MEERFLKYIELLENNHSLTRDEYEFLLSSYSEETAKILAHKAFCISRKIFGESIYIRGLIEISNYCKNNCYYCGIQSANTGCVRYRLTRSDILNCCREGYTLGFRTYVLQGGEDKFFTDDRLCEIITTIKQEFPDCAITLSLGERTDKSYQLLRNAGADRYLLRHETADEHLYQVLHPSTMSWNNRMKCLSTLKDLGYQTGCGFMVGAPSQTLQSLAKDLKFIEKFKPHMCGIGPFIPHHATKYHDMPAGNVDFTCYLLSILRIMQPNILLPATTALASLDDTGQIKGILAGANVIMPNLSPTSVRKHYELYNHKAFTGTESAQSIQLLKQQLAQIGYSIKVCRGDAFS